MLQFDKSYTFWELEHLSYILHSYIQQKKKEKLEYFIYMKCDK